MVDYESRMNKAYDDILEASIESDKFSFFILGIGKYAIVNQDGMGGFYVNYKAVMTTIYRNYKSHPEYQLSSLLTNTYREIIEKYPNISSYNWVLNMIEYQLFCEKYNLATFKMDFSEILGLIKEKINKNKDLFYSQIETYSRLKGEEIINQHNESLSEYGMKLY